MFVHWVALHETTHAFQFASVPWLREHLGGMVEKLLHGAGLGPDLGELRDAIGRIVRRPDPRRLAEPLREGGLIQLVAGPEQAEALRGLQATMSVIEGYAEHVMDAVGEDLDPGYARLRDALESERRSRNLIDTLFARLLGLDLKLRQYELGKRFADTVAEQCGDRPTRSPTARSSSSPSDGWHAWPSAEGYLAVTTSHDSGTNRCSVLCSELP
jgi:coenzyme F420 biosynthesis associated uncharacterized protein